jgi:CheY-like chemotaxis protein
MPPLDTGCLLLALSAGQPRSVDELARACITTPQETASLLHRLIVQGFVVFAGDAASGPRYEVARTAPATGHDEHIPRILLLEDDAGTLDVMTVVLEAEGYSVVASTTPAAGMRLLDAVPFDLVLTDSFSRTPTGVLMSTAGVLWAAGPTPVILFTTHLLHREIVQAMGFRDLITKPFDLEHMLQQVSALLARPPNHGASTAG